MPNDPNCVIIWQANSAYCTYRGEWGNPEHLLIEAYKIMVKQGLVKITIPIKE